MRDFQQKKKVKRTIYSRKMIAILFVVAFILVRGAWGVYSKERESGQALDTAREEYKEFSERQLALTSKIEKLETERGKEEEIRERFSVTKPGEELVVIVDQSSSQDEGEGEEMPFWKKFLGFLFGN